LIKKLCPSPRTEHWPEQQMYCKYLKTVISPGLISGVCLYPKHFGSSGKKITSSMPARAKE
jgi:hypothetical protein